MADPDEPDEPGDEERDPDIGERARAVAADTAAAAGAIGRKLRDGLRGGKPPAPATGPSVPAALRRLGKDMGGLLEKVTVTSGRGIKKVAGQVADTVKTAVDQIGDKPADGGDKPDDGGKPDDDSSAG